MLRRASSDEESFDEVSTSGLEILSFEDTSTVLLQVVIWLMIEPGASFRSRNNIWRPKFNLVARSKCRDTSGPNGRRSYGAADSSSSIYDSIGGFHPSAKLTSSMNAKCWRILLYRLRSQ